MPENEVARCLVCGKVQMVKQYAGNVVDLGDGVVVVGIDETDPDDLPMFWPDGLALASCDIHTEAERMAAFSKYPEDHWLEGKPHGSN